MVLDETTGEGRLFQTGIVAGKKKNFSRHHYKQIVFSSVIPVMQMPEYALGWVPGSLCLYQETLFLVSVSCKRWLRRTTPCGTPGMPLKFVKHFADATGVPPWPTGPPSYTYLHFLHNRSLSFIIGMPNAILKLKSNQCFVCNFLSMPRCHCQIAPKKTQSVSCLACKFLKYIDPNQDCM